MSKLVEFMEFVSKNEDVRKELEALRPELEGKSEQERNEAFVKFAAKHGFTLTAEDFASKMDFSSDMQKLSLEELKAVAGGKGCGIVHVIVEGSDCGWCNYSNLW